MAKRTAKQLLMLSTAMAAYCSQEIKPKTVTNKKRKKKKGSF